VGYPVSESLILQVVYLTPQVDRVVEDTPAYSVGFGMVRRRDGHTTPEASGLVPLFAS
jgi:hypothetical protein